MAAIPIPIRSRQLDDREVEALHGRWCELREPEVRDRLLDHHAPLAEVLARRSYRRGEPLEDLTQVAYEALLRALDRFDPSRGVPFAAYAVPTIRGAIKRHFRDQGWSVRVPRRVHELAPAMDRATARLCQRLGRQPTTVEVAEELSVPTEAIAAAQQAIADRSAESVEQSVGTFRERRFAHVDGGFERSEQMIDLREALGQLPQPDLDLLARYYIEEQTQAAIADQDGVSQMQISRRLSAARAELRYWMEP